MAGGIIIVVILLLFPVIVALSGAVMAAIIGYLGQRDVDAEFVDSEYLELGR